MKLRLTLSHQGLWPSSLSCMSGLFCILLLLLPNQLPHCARDVRRADAGRVEQLVWLARARHLAHRQVSQLDVEGVRSGKRGEHRFAKTTFGPVVLGHHDS